MADEAFLKGTVGRIKLALLIIGSLHVICLSASYVSNDSRDVAFLLFTIIFYIITAVVFFLTLFGVFVPGGSLQRFDMFYHGIAFIILIVCGIFFLVSVLSHGHTGLKFLGRLLALFFGLWNSLIHGLLTWHIIRHPDTYTS